MENICRDTCEMEFGLWNVFTLRCQLGINHDGDHRHVGKTGKHELTITWGRPIETIEEK